MTLYKYKHDILSGTINTISIPLEDIGTILGRQTVEQAVDIWVRLQNYQELLTIVMKNI